MNIEKSRNYLEKRPLLTVATLLVAAAAIAGCSEVNSSGEGNEFEVVGVVVDAGNESLKIEVQDISMASGAASNWFNVGNEHQIHDNCDCGDGFWSSRETYGVVYDFNGSIVEPKEIDEGSCVLFDGKIREYVVSDGETSTTKQRPVFDLARQVSC